ncbi:MAG: hypothetical protein C5B53_09455 [Candidatus Melainabacteria bacterium]|nr:MAG: hypothetical protein C5B53_09455 [Candidatus Melainabacteria bacterium]
MGKFQGGSFQAIQEYFQQKFCRNCDCQFASEGIQLLRQEPGVLVVRVTCKACGHPLGVAIVGTVLESNNNKEPVLPADWSRKDAERLAGKAPISYDDVLEAHQFFDQLGANWAQYLPKTGKIS